MTVKDYLRGKTLFPIDDSVIDTIVIDRIPDATNETNVSTLKQRDRELLYADLLMTIIETSAPCSQKSSVGDTNYSYQSKSIDRETRNSIYRKAQNIYAKWNDDRLDKPKSIINI